MLKLKTWIEDSPKTPLFWVALLRIMLGLLFLTQWYDNLINGIYTEEGLNGLFEYFFSTSDMPLEWYMDFIHELVMPTVHRPGIHFRFVYPSSKPGCCIFYPEYILSELWR
jgi:hypothetical protein